MIYVSGDLHGTVECGHNCLSFHSWPLGRELTRNDVVIVAGDFGYVWGGGNTDAYWLKWLEGRPWTMCFVDGNHENHRLLAAMPERERCGVQLPGLPVNDIASKVMLLKDLARRLLAS